MPIQPVKNIGRTSCLLSADQPNRWQQSAEDSNTWRRTGRLWCRVDENDGNDADAEEEEEEEEEEYIPVLTYMYAHCTGFIHQQHAWPTNSN